VRQRDVSENGTVLQESGEIAGSGLPIRERVQKWMRRRGRPVGHGGGHS
jgi:hypothetical protein